MTNAFAARMLGELALKTLHGDSAVRTQSPGANFQLTEHSLYGSVPGRDDNQFVALTALRRTDLTHAQYRALPKAQQALYAPIRDPVHQSLCAEVHQSAATKLRQPH